MTSFNVEKILTDLKDMHKKLGEHIISDTDCMSIHDEDAEFDEVVFLGTLQKIEKRIEQSIDEVMGDTGYTLTYCKEQKKIVGERI